MALTASCEKARRRLADREQTDDAGRAIDGNTKTLKAGHRSEQLQAALAPIRAAIETATLTLALGFPPDGPERPPEALRMTGQRSLAGLDVLSETFWTYIETLGPLTLRGENTRGRDDLARDRGSACRLANRFAAELTTGLLATPSRREVLEAFEGGDAKRWRASEGGKRVARGIKRARSGCTRLCGSVRALPPEADPLTAHRAGSRRLPP